MAGLWELTLVRNKILEMASENRTLDEIAVEIGVHPGSIARLIRKHKVEYHPPRYLAKEYRIQETLRMSQLDYPVQRIARILGVTERQVQRYRRWAGVATQFPQQISQEKLDRALEFLKDGTGYAEAARSVGCQASTLRKHFPGYAMPLSVRNQINTAIREANRKERLGL